MASRSETRNVVVGALLTLGLNGGVAIAGFFLGILAPIILFTVFSAIGIFQLLYIIPILLWLRRDRRWSYMKGVAIGVVITALLNGGCWIFLLNNLGY